MRSSAGPIVASRAPPFGWAFLCLLLGCAGRGGGTAVALHDSAGVAIVESRAPQWPAGRGWRIDARPLLAIGAGGAAPPHEFERIDGAARLPDGRIVVADGGMSTVSMFDPAGGLVWSVGRSGDGPGEYRLMQGLGVGPGDSLWVYDFGLRRFTILTLDGRVARTVSLGGDLSAVGAVGRLGDGRFVVREFWSAALAAGGGASGLRRDPAAIALLAPDGRLADTVALVLGREVFISEEGGRAVMSAPLFAHTASVVLRGERVIAGDQARFELGEYDADGTLERSIRILGLDLTVSDADRRQLVDEALAGHPPAERPAILRQLAAMDVPPTRPAYGDLVVDAAGNVWAAEYARGPGVPSAWTVLDSTGRWLGPVQMPERFRPLQVGADWVLGVSRDAMDVESVTMYALKKGAGSDE